MRIKALALALILALFAAPSYAQVLTGPVGGAGGGGGGGSGDFSGPASSTADDFVQFNGTGGKTGKDGGYGPASFAPAGSVIVISGSNPTTNAAAWLAFTQYTVAGSGRTVTIPATSTLSTSGGLDIDANTNSATLQANAADTITFSGATTATGGSVTLPAGMIYRVSTDAAGKLYVSGRMVQGNGLKVQLSTGSTTTNNCVKFDANGNTVDAGSACGGSSVNALQNLQANNWYWTTQAAGTSNGSATSAGTVYYRPHIASATNTISNIGFKITVLSAAGNCAVGLYASGSNGLPTGAPLASASGITTASVGLVHGAVSAQETAGGTYWDAVLCDNSTVAFLSEGTGNISSAYVVGTTAEANLSGNTTFFVTQYTSSGATYPTLPTSPTISQSGPTATRSPLFYHQVATVP